MPPKTSIITPLHNKGPYIAETIQSVLEQTMTDWEMIIVENGSTDNGLEVVSKFSDPRIRLLVSPKFGPGAARNFGLDHATGEWILFLDADDLIEPHYLQEQLKTATDNPDSDVVVGCWREFGVNSTNAVNGGLRTPTAFHESCGEVLESAIAFAPWAIHAALIKRRNDDRALRWPETLDKFPSEDTAYWFSLLQNKKIAWSSSEGALYRIGNDGNRNARPESLLWVHGLRGIIETNISMLHSLNKKLTGRQTASIMRTYEDRYISALKAGDAAVAELFLAEATKWLQDCRSSNLSIILRKILGISLFVKLHHRA